MPTRDIGESIRIDAAGGLRMPFCPLTRVARVRRVAAAGPRPAPAAHHVESEEAEGIINNVRKTFIRDQLTDPRSYEQMSTLLDDLIKQSREDAAAYKEFLQRAEALMKRLAARQPEDGVPAVLHGRREATAIYNNLPRILSAGRSARANRVAESPEEYGNGDERLRLALEIDRVMREQSPAGWKGDQAREVQVLNALFPLLNRDREVTLALFELVKNQPGY